MQVTECCFSFDIFTLLLKKKCRKRRSSSSSTSFRWNGHTIHTSKVLSTVQLSQLAALISLIFPFVIISNHAFSNVHFQFSSCFISINFWVLCLPVNAPGILWASWALWRCSLSEVDHRLLSSQHSSSWQWWTHHAVPNSQLIWEVANRGCGAEDNA